MTRTLLARFGLAAVAAGALLALPGGANAQFYPGFGYGGGGGYNRIGPYGPYGPFANTQAGVYMRHLNDIGFSRNGWNTLEYMGQLNYLYGGGGYGYGGGYGGSGADSGSMADFYKQRAELVKQLQAAQKAKEDKKKKLLDEMRFEQLRIEKANREADRGDRLRRSRSEPDVPEIASGWALNDLLAEITKYHSTSGLRGPLVPLDADVVAKINFAGGVMSGGVGLFKAGKPLEWPAALTAESFKDQRAAVDAAIPAALQQVKAGGPDKPALKQLNDAITAVRDKLRAARDEVPGADYINALEYLRRLEDSGLALGAPNAAALLDGSANAKGAAVHELVEDMAGKKLKFAPAPPGDERAYNTLYQALLAYANGLGAVAAKN